MVRDNHPVGHEAAALYHALLAGLLLLGVGFHLYSALSHWKDRDA